MQLPSAFEHKMKDMLGEEFDDYLACYEEPRYYGLRVNTRKITVEKFIEICPFEIKPIPWIHNGFYYDGEHVSPAKHPYYFAGLYYLQEPSAMTPASRLFIDPEDKVLDICAAPGGKATELGARLYTNGVLAANDISSSRAKGLLKNLEIFGIGNALILSEEPGRLTEYFAGYFDKILIDAPCSGEGMFRKDKKMMKAWEEHGPEFFCRLQKGILANAADMLKPGGLILYSTCTFDPMENEQVIEHLLELRDDFTLCDMLPYEGFCGGRPEWGNTGNEDLRKTVHIFPHKMHGEGHYLALLKKEGCVKEDGPAPQIYKTDAKTPEDLAVFLNDISVKFETSRLDIRGERIYYMPSEIPKLNGIRFLRTGLLLGELKKNRFEPSQALAMYLKKEEYRHVIDLPLSDDRIIKYLKGETLDLSDVVQESEKGWYLICVDSFPLGFGKLLNGTLKNKYLPGWRWQS